jgi:hypothetical protein
MRVPGAVGGFRVAGWRCGPGSYALGRVKCQSEGLCYLLAEGFSNRCLCGAFILSKKAVNSYSKCCSNFKSILYG